MDATAAATTISAISDQIGETISARVLQILPAWALSPPVVVGLPLLVAVILGIALWHRRRSRSLTREALEAGLRRLLNRVADPHLAAQIDRVLLELHSKRRFSPGPNSLRVLDEICTKATGADFERFCRTQESSLLPIGRMLRSAIPNFGAQSDEVPWLSDRLREVHQALQWIDQNCGFNPETYVGIALRVERAKASYRVSGTAYKSIDRLYDSLHGPVVLLGDPGGGKSVSLRHLGTILSARAASSKIDQRTPLPIYVHLGDYTNRTDSGVPQPLDEYIVRHSSAVWNQPYEDAKARFEILAMSGNLVFLFDSLDEMPRDDYAERYDQILLFMRRFGLCRYVYACRPVDYDHRLGATEVTVESMPDKQIESYLKRYLRLATKAPSSGTSSIIRSLRDSSGQYPSYLTNPFYLSLAASYLASAGQTPTSLASMYQQIIDAVLKESHHGESSPRADEANRFLAVMAWLGYQATRHEGTGTEIEVDRLLALAASDPEISPAALNATIARGDQLKILRLRELGRRTVTFQHHRFQEYFAARYLLGKEGQLHQYLPPSGVLGGIWWQETIALLCSITPNPSVVLDYLFSLKVPEQVLRRLGQDSRQRAEFVDSERLELLARCYEASADRAGDGPGLRILSEIAGRLPGSNPAERVRCIRALARIRHPRADGLLRERLDDTSAWVREESFGTLLNRRSLANLTRRFLLDYLWQSVATGRGFVRGATMVRSLAKQRVLPDMLLVAILTTLLGLCIGFGTLVALLVSAAVLVHRGARPLFVIICLAPFFVPAYMSAKLFRAINLQRQVPAIAVIAVYSVGLHFALRLPGYWPLLAIPTVLASLFVIAHAVNAALSKMSFWKKLEEAMTIQASHQELHQNMALLQQRAEGEGGTIHEPLMIELAALYGKGCMHVRLAVVNLVRSYRVDYPAYLILKRHAGSLPAQDPYCDDVWQLVVEKSYQLRRDAVIAGEAEDPGILVNSALVNLSAASFDEVVRAQRTPLGVVGILALADSFEQLGRVDQCLAALRSALALAPLDKTIGERIASLERELRAPPGRLPASGSVVEG